MQESPYRNINKQMDSEQLENEKINLEKNRKIFNRYFLFFLTLALLAGSFWLGYSRGKSARGAEDQPFLFSQTTVSNKFLEKKDLDFSLFWKVWDILGQKYVNKDSLDAKKMMYGAIRGMLRATDDPYTNFFDPQESKSFSQDLEGSFQGIGAELGIKDDILTVIAPLEDSPAQKAGLRAGDKILKIGDKPTTDITIDEAVDLIRGKKGTEVKLIVLHADEQETREISIIRDNIEVKSIKLEMKPEHIAHLKINKFGEETAREFNAAAGQIVSSGARGIILDLRNNPGGFLESSVDIASRMMPKDKIVVIEEDNTGRRENISTRGGDKLSAIPTVILINEGSASASEILAGALRDNLGLKLIGKKSFGKGSVQELIQLPGNSSVKITVAKWLTPSGEHIMEKGITPDIEIDLTTDDFKNNRDPQLDKALEVLKEMII
jgi:carboxyl-terminal processing protease